MHLALDLALGTTGLCTGTRAGDSFTLTVPKHTTGGERLAWWRHELEGYLLPVDTVVVEAPIIYPGHTVGQINTIKLHGLIEWMCHDADVWYTACAPSKLKKWATGSGNASKDLMMACAQERGWDGHDHNEADAWLLWHWYEAKNAAEAGA